jgi:hypothetical protein
MNSLPEKDESYNQQSLDMPCQFQRHWREGAIRNEGLSLTPDKGILNLQESAKLWWTPYTEGNEQ